MEYANILTGEMNVAILPATVVIGNLYYPRPSEGDYLNAGWRVQTGIDATPDGQIPEGYVIVDDGNGNCHLAITSTHPIPPPPPIPPEDPAILAARQAYRDTTRRFCVVADIAVVDKLDTPAVQSAVQAAGSGPTAFPFTQLAFALFVQISDLRRMDGDSAWDRI